MEMSRANLEESQNMTSEYTSRGVLFIFLCGHPSPWATEIQTGTMFNEFNELGNL